MAEAPDDKPPEFERAASYVLECGQAKQAGRAAPPLPFARGSEAWWWHQLLLKRPFRGV